MKQNFCLNKIAYTMMKPNSSVDRFVQMEYDQAILDSCTRSESCIVSKWSPAWWVYKTKITNPQFYQFKFLFLNFTLSSISNVVSCLNHRNPPLFSSSSLASISPPAHWNPPLLFSSFFCFDYSTSSLSLCFLERLFTVPIFTFKLLVKKMSLLCFVHESSTLHMELTSPHLSFYYLLCILFFILMRCECNRNLRIMLEIQTILQTADVVNDYW